MQKIFIERTAIITIAIFFLFGCINNAKEDQTKINTVEPLYDSTLAKELGADTYGMSKYVMAFLKRGPNRPEEKMVRDSLQRAHLKNIEHLAQEGKLALAGPFLDNGEIRGIYIFAVETVEEARKLTESDPAIQAGSLIMELHPWYGSAAIKEINNIHSKIQKSAIVD